MSFAPCKSPMFCLFPRHLGTMIMLIVPRPTATRCSIDRPTRSYQIPARRAQQGQVQAAMVHPVSNPRAATQVCTALTSGCSGLCTDALLEATRHPTTRTNPVVTSLTPLPSPPHIPTTLNPLLLLLDLDPEEDTRMETARASGSMRGRAGLGGESI